MSFRKFLVFGITIYLQRYKHKPNFRYLQRTNSILSSAVIKAVGLEFLIKNNNDAETANNSTVNFAKTSRAKDNFIVDVIKKCAPSVVYIEIKDSRKVLPETGEPVTASNGSGFIITDDGWIMTNAHVVMNKPNSLVMVTTDDGQVYRAEVKEVDLRTDLALLKIGAKNLKALKFGDSNDISVGEWVVALGSPLSLSHTITAGVVSSVNRDAVELGISNQSMKYIQTDAAITFGHSGGPLVNLDGEVIGINNLRITAGIAFAIPIEYAKKFMNNSVLKNPKTLEPTVQKSLGIATISLDALMIQCMHDEKTEVPKNLSHGVLAWKVIDGMEAHKWGIQTGDVITHMNGLPIYDGSDFFKNLDNNLKKTVTISLFRKGKKKEIKIKM